MPAGLNPLGTYPGFLEGASTGAKTGFNPLSLLASPIAGAIPGFSASSSATSEATLNQMISSPFNVGSGSQRADASGSFSGDGILPMVSQESLVGVGLLVLGVGAGAWLLQKAMK